MLIDENMPLYYGDYAVIFTLKYYAWKCYKL